MKKEEAWLKSCSGELVYTYYELEIVCQARPGQADIVGKYNYECSFVIELAGGYTMEESPTNVSNATFQDFKQRIWKIIWRYIVEENPTSVTSANL